MKEYLNQKINNCQEEMETHFQNLGNVYSKLLDEIKNKTLTAETVISDYKSHLRNEHTQNITMMVRFLESNVADLKKNLSIIDQDLNNSISVLNKNLEQFYLVEKNITEIKEYSELMELMALNSMVVAIKAGSRGGGFTYITEVLRKNASATIQLTDELQDLGDQLKNNLGDLHNLLAELNDQRNTLSSKEKDMNEKFAEFHHSMDEFIQVLNNLSSDSSSIRRDVLAISETLSHQDIYRQSLDHITMLLKVLPDQEVNDRESRLDKISYFELLNDFSIPLIQDIMHKLNSNIDTFDSKTNGVHHSLKKVEQKRKDYVQSNSGSSKKDCCIFYKISLVDQSLQALLFSMKGFLKEIEGVSMLNRGIVDRIVNLDERNKRFERIIKAFRNVIIMGRIEVTKHDALRGVEVSVNDIADITDNIESKAAKTSDSIDQILSMNQSIVDRIHILREHVNEFMELFTNKLEDFNRITEEGREIFNRTMDSLNFYPHSFSNYFKSALHASKELKQVNSLLGDLSEQLESDKTEIKKEKSMLLKEFGLEKWSIKNENIKRVLEKFTIYSQKNAALKLAGTDNGEDQAVDESAVVLF